MFIIHKYIHTQRAQFDLGIDSEPRFDKWQVDTKKNKRIIAKSCVWGRSHKKKKKNDLWSTKFFESSNYRTVSFEKPRVENKAAALTNSEMKNKIIGFIHFFLFFSEKIFFFNNFENNFVSLLLGNLNISVLLSYRYPLKGVRDVIFLNKFSDSALFSTKNCGPIKIVRIRVGSHNCCLIFIHIRIMPRRNRSDIYIHKFNSLLAIKSWLDEKNA